MVGSRVGHSKQRLQDDILLLGPQISTWLNLRVIKETQAKKKKEFILSKMSDFGGLSSGMT